MIFHSPEKQQNNYQSSGILLRDENYLLRIVIRLELQTLRMLTQCRSCQTRAKELKKIGILLPISIPSYSLFFLFFFFISFATKPVFVFLYIYFFTPRLDYLKKADILSFALFQPQTNGSDERLSLEFFIFSSFGLLFLMNVENALFNCRN